MIAGGATPEIRNCAFIESRGVGEGTTTESMGGGISSHSDLPITVRGCRFEGNTLSNFYAQGGSLYTRGGGIFSFLGGITVMDCVFIGNSAHAGGGLYSWAETTVINSLFMENMPADFPGSTDSVPMFVDVSSGGLHLSPGSPCIDSGDNSAVPVGILTDLDGGDRFLDDPDTPASALRRSWTWGRSSTRVRGCERRRCSLDA